VDLSETDLWHYSVLTEGACAHEVVQLLALAGEPAGAVRHHAVALRDPDDAAQVCFAALAELAVSALWDVQRDHMVAHFDAGHALSNRLYDAASFVAQDAGEQALWVLAAARVLVCQ
jgi:hypothetical protein